MKTLAIDASTMTGSVALLDDDQVVGEYMLSLKRTHSERLLPALDEMLHRAGTSVRDIDLLAVSAGPGSYTGLRIGIGTVKGLAFALDRPAIGVSTLEALAAGTAFWPGLIVPMLDARHRNVFAAGFRSDGVRLTGDLAEGYYALDDFLGMEGFVPPVLFVGEAALKYADGILAQMPQARIADSVHSQVRAAYVGVVGRLRYLGGDPGNPALLAARYLRASEAEVRREGEGRGAIDSPANGAC